MIELRTWRKGEGKSTAEAGAGVGVSGVQWHRYETGERKVPLDRLHAVSEMTGIDASRIRPDLVAKIAALAGEPAQ